MKRKHLLTFVIIFLFQTSVSLSQMQLPTSQWTVKNITTVPGPNCQDSLLEFEIYMMHTNPGASDPFNYASGKYHLNYNIGIGTGMGLKKIGSDLPPENQCPVVSALNGRFSCSPNIPVDNNVIVPSTYPGIMVIKLQARTSQHHWNIVPINLVWRMAGTAPFSKVTYYDPNGVVVEIPNTLVNAQIDNAAFTPPAGTSILLKLKLLFEGTYDAGGNILTRKDPVNIFLRNAQSPYNIVESTSGIIDSVSHTGLFEFLNSPSGSYFIVVNHFQCVEVWSKAGGESLVANCTEYNYDFTNSISQAFGDNLTLKNDKYCLYSGDVNQDGGINLSDLIPIINDVNNFASNNPANDLNGDQFIDLTDLIIAFNNSSKFVYRITP